MLQHFEARSTKLMILTFNKKILLFFNLYFDACNAGVDTKKLPSNYKVNPNNSKKFNHQNFLIYQINPACLTKFSFIFMF